MYYTVELMNTEDFVERIENQCRHELAEKLRKQNRSPSESRNSLKNDQKPLNPKNRFDIIHAP